jgi:hypothetical protein
MVAESMMRWISVRRIGIVMAALTAAGCGKEVPISNDMGGSTLCIRYYRQCVDPVFHKILTGGVSCTQSTCHDLDGAGGRFKLNVSPSLDAQFAANFISAERMASLNGLLFTEPLAGGTDHGGPKLFATTADPDYQILEYWATSRVDDPGDMDPALDSAQCIAVYNNSPIACP